MDPVAGVTSWNVPLQQFSKLQCTNLGLMILTSPCLSTIKVTYCNVCNPLGEHLQSTYDVQGPMGHLFSYHNSSCHVPSTFSQTLPSSCEANFLILLLKGNETKTSGIDMLNIIQPGSGPGDVWLWYQYPKNSWQMSWNTENKRGKLLKKPNRVGMMERNQWWEGTFTEKSYYRVWK